MALPYPNFYLEQPTSLAYGGSQPLWTHGLWKLRNVHPEINGTINHGQNDGWAFTPSGLASGMLNHYFYFKRNLEQFASRTITNYSIKIAGLGNGGFINSNSIWLMNGQIDLAIGATGNGSTFSDYIAPWAPTGVSKMVAWGVGPTGFWFELKKNFAASGVGNPNLMAITTENIPDSTRAYAVGGGTGWIERLLGLGNAAGQTVDPRSTGILFNGVQTLQNYWNTATGWYDNTPIPTGKTACQYCPEDVKLGTKAVSAWYMGQRYATFKGIIEPFWQVFASGIDVPEYRIFGFTNTTHGPDTYPGQDPCLMNTFWQPAQGVDFYSDVNHAHDSQGLGTPPYYWDSASGWMAVYPRPIGYIGYNARDYSILRYGQDKIFAAQNAYPTAKAYPWLSMQVSSFGQDKIPIMVDFLKYCYSIGVTNFYTFEGSGFLDTKEADAWLNVINQINGWVDSLSAQSGYLVSTVARIGCTFLKF